MRLAGIVAAFCMGSFWGHAVSPDTAERAYHKGDYRTAQKEYDTLAKGTPDDPRYQFNAGAAAYKMSNFTNAAAYFEAARGARDLGLQQKAYYNLGNTLYQMGFREQDPRAKIQTWQQALTNYNSALKLNPSDTNAASNLQFVKAKVEELMRQQPQPPKNRQQNQDQDKDKDKDKDQDKDQQQQQQDSNQDQASKPKNSKDQSGKNSQDKNKDKQQDGQDSQASKDPQDPKDEKNETAKNDPNQGKDKDKDKDQNAGKDQGSQAGKPGDEKNGKGQAVGMEEGKAGEMSPAQAARLLDEQKGDEKALVFQPGQGKRPTDPAKRSRKTW